MAVNPASVKSHSNYREKFSLPFPLLSDADRAVSHAYDAVKANGKSIERTVIIIDTDGVIRYLKRGMPKDVELLEVLNGLNS